MKGEIEIIEKPYSTMESRTLIKFKIEDSKFEDFFETLDREIRQNWSLDLGMALRYLGSILFKKAKER